MRKSLRVTSFKKRHTNCADGWCVVDSRGPEYTGHKESSPMATQLGSCLVDEAFGSISIAHIVSDIRRTLEHRLPSKSAPDPDKGPVLEGTRLAQRT